MTLSQQQQEFTQDVSKLIQYIAQQGYHCSLGEAFRTEEQAKIYASCGKGILDSLHCKRLAIDINLFAPGGGYLSDSKAYEQFGVYWEALHPLNRWGGRFTRGDGNHFERQEST